MSGFKDFAVVGVGAIGSFIVEELLEAKSRGDVSTIRILSRSSPAKFSDIAAKGADIVTIDFASQESLQSALQDIDVVISTVGVEALSSQGALADAAKAANVQLFVPSEFGFETAEKSEEEEIPELAKAKRTFRKKFHDIDLPYAAFYTGLFPDFIFTEGWFAKGLGLDFSNRIFTLRGPAQGLISFTGRKDVARYVVFVLMTLPRKEILWKTFRIEAERTSFKGIIDQYQRHLSLPVEVLQAQRRDGTLDDAVSQEEDMFEVIYRYADRGEVVAAEVEGLDNALFPDWSPLKATDLIMYSLSDGRKR